MKRKLGLPVILLLLWLVVYPISIVVLESFVGDEGFTLEFIRAFAGDSTEWKALWNSLWISFASVFSAAALGIPLAFVFERLQFPGSKTLGALVALPAVLPPLVGVIAFSFLYGESGFVGRAVGMLLGMRGAPWRLEGAGAILLVHAYSMYVYFYLFCRAGLAKMDRSAVEAAQSLGASRVETLVRVTLPLLRPQIGAAALLVFMTSLGSFSAPFIFGGGFRVMTTQIVASKLNGDLTAAMVETTALATMAVLGLLLFRWLQGDKSVAAVGKGAPPPSVEIGSRTAQLAAAVFGWTFAAILLLPHLTLVIVSFVPLGTWTTQLMPPEYSLVNYVALFSEPERFRPLFNSLWMGATATIVAITISLWAGREIVQKRVRLGKIIEGLLNVPWVVPGTVLAIALATTFSVQAPVTGRWILVGTALILPMAYVIRNIPIAAGSVVAGFRQLDPSLDEAASSLGAGKARRIFTVTVPLLLPAILAGGALAFATAVGDFVTSIVLYTFETRPISIEILSSLRGYEIGVAAAYGVILMLITAGAMALGTRR